MAKLSESRELEYYEHSSEVSPRYEKLDDTSQGRERKNGRHYNRFLPQQSWLGSIRYAGMWGNPLSCKSAASRSGRSLSKACSKLWIEICSPSITATYLSVFFSTQGNMHNYWDAHQITNLASPSLPWGSQLCKSVVHMIDKSSRGHDDSHYLLQFSSQRCSQK